MHIWLMFALIPRIGKCYMSLLKESLEFVFMNMFSVVKQRVERKLGLGSMLLEHLD
jgi:hypothetical protein